MRSSRRRSPWPTNRGSRARIYKSSTLRGRVKEEFPDAVEWPPIGLPEDCLPLLAAGRSAFVRQNQRIVQSWRRIA